ncbi:hypothetical protein [Companilactobacillus pabuli]|jgi:hypothetical protein|uniref:Uncharacterized protein n=1 Tax=Companilactobacillus pabuli TaxID=2714036 RepID=A0A7L7KTT2_9LACO|nr:hypothetical protein [Companilactobacillus pabuli]QMT83147.1 hypothetical protein G6534_00090 [Companilactobacillus pabuli]GAQ02463.1 hypothetical protein NBRC111452_2307 [Companilactobacillus farciminis]
MESIIQYQLIVLPYYTQKMVNWLYKPQKVEATWIIPDPSGFNFLFVI